MNLPLSLFVCDLERLELSSLIPIIQESHTLDSCHSFRSVINLFTLTNNQFSNLTI
ncbi:hypothetical protein Hanom_Chr04g00280341 [Helianthus anomalus]